MTESKPKLPTSKQLRRTDLQGYELPKGKPGPKEKPNARKKVVKTHLSESEHVRLIRLAQLRNLDQSSYMRWLLDRDWDLMGHRTDRASPIKHTRKRN